MSGIREKGVAGMAALGLGKKSKSELRGGGSGAPNGAGGGGGKVEVDKSVSGYLTRMEQAGMVQSFGCVLLLEERTLRIVAYSENVPQMLCVQQKGLPGPVRFVLNRIKKAILRSAKSGQKKPGIEELMDDPEDDASLQSSATGSESSKQLHYSPSSVGTKSSSQAEMRRSVSEKMGKGGITVGVGSDVRVLFTRASVAALERAASAADISVMNPVLVQCSLTNQPFYAILHRHHGGGLLVDLEPILPSDPTINGAGALQSHMLAAKAVARLQGLPSGNMQLLFQAVVEEIRNLTGYDRVMAYKFHDDEHGEVIAEDRKRNLPPYLGLHYPATDIPKAARILFLKNRSRMICDAKSKPVKMVQDKWNLMKSPVSIGPSTLRAVHACHTQYLANMGVTATLTLSLVMREQDGTIFVSMPNQQQGSLAASGRTTSGSASANTASGAAVSVGGGVAASDSASVRSGLGSGSAQFSAVSRSSDGVDSDGESDDGEDGVVGGVPRAEGGSQAALSTLEEVQGRKLWGMVVCHHLTARYVPYPVRAACEFLMQVFGLQLTKEIEIESQQQEQHILYLQTLLCDLMLQNNPLASLMEASPGVMDLVKCDGVALLHDGKVQTKGVTPTEVQIRDLISWLRQSHPGSTGVTIDSLVAAGYPKACEIGDKVCGVAGAALSDDPKDDEFIFWFRSHVEKEIHWSGAKQEQTKKKTKENFRKMTPRASFAAFLEVVRHRSQPWGELEMDSIYSAQMILKDALQRAKMRQALVAAGANGGDGGDARAVEATLPPGMTPEELEKLYTATFDQLVHFIETASAPILAVDSAGAVTGWNKTVARLTGLPFELALGKSLCNDLVDVACREAVQRALTAGFEGSELPEVYVRLHVWGAENQPGSSTTGGTVVLLANTFVSRDAAGNPQGVCFVGQDVTQERAVRDQFVKVQGDYSAIIHSRTSLIPPIFGCDEFGRCVEWNRAMEDLTGLKRSEVMDRMLAGGVFGGLCRLESHDARTKFMVVLSKAMAGHEAHKLPFSFLNKQKNLVEVLLSVHPRYSLEGTEIVGAFCFLHTASAELQQTIKLQRATERIAAQKAREAAYLREMIKGPLDGLQYALAMLQSSPQAGGKGLMASSQQTKQQQQWLRTSTALVEQVRSVLEDLDMRQLEEGHVVLQPNSTFTMEAVMSAVIAQATPAANAGGSRITLELAHDLRTLPLSGDPWRLQQILGGLVVMAARFTPPAGLIKVEGRQRGTKNLRATTMLTEVEIRVYHTGEGIPEELIEQMMDEPGEGAGQHMPKCQEGLVLSLERRVLKSMDGDISYVRDTHGGGRCHFLTVFDVALASAVRRLGGIIPV